jgi:hypothetical protein
MDTEDEKEQRRARFKKRKQAKKDARVQDKPKYKHDTRKIRFYDPSRYGFMYIPDEQED